MLEPCPECGHKVSDKATVCPRCGHPLQWYGTAFWKRYPDFVWGVRFWLLMSLLIVFLIFYFYAAATNP